MSAAYVVPAPVAEEEVYSKVTVWKRFRRHRMAMAGVVVLAISVLHRG